MSGWAIAAVLAIIAAAMFTRSAFGFGHGAFAMPLLVLVLDPRAATPLLAAVSFTVSLFILARDRGAVRLGSTLVLTVGALLGIPAGVALLVHVDGRTVASGLALLLIAVSLRSLYGASLPRLDDDRSAPLFGLAAGVLGGAFNLIGIPVALYGQMRGWNPAEFRAALNGFFLLTGLVGLIGQFAAGLFDAQVTWLVLLALPGAWAGYALGTGVGGSMDRRTFERWIWGLVLVSAIALLVGGR